MKDQIIINNKSYDVLVALTEEEQENGLMFKPWPPPIMIFPFNSYGIRKFWMANTISPLDIVFCKNSTIIDICDGDPLSYKFVGPEIKTNLVMEFPKGFTKSNNICIGDSVKIVLSINSLSKKFVQ